VIFVSGFAIWNVDNILCSSITATKRAIGMPLSFLLELHGWWHIFTGVGAYICMLFPIFFSQERLLIVFLVIALVEYLTSEEAGQPLGKSFAWPVGQIVNCSAGAKANGTYHTRTIRTGAVRMNGNGKKSL